MKPVAPSTPILVEIFRHHAWANERLVEACASLGSTELDLTVPGTYGSVRDTIVHLLAAEERFVALLGEAMRHRFQDPHTPYLTPRPGGSPRDWLTSSALVGDRERRLTGARVPARTRRERSLAGADDPGGRDAVTPGLSD
ncbi:MAG: DinB family protein [Candidatus Limnocylindria bacterium]